MAQLRATYSSHDAGWGCTLRAQQSQVAHALLRCGHSPLVIADLLLSPRSEDMSDPVPATGTGLLSFQRLLAACGSAQPGQFIGPSVAAHGLALLSSSSSHMRALGCSVLAFPGGALSDTAICAATSAGGSVLVLLPLRLSVADTLDAASSLSLRSIMQGEPAFAGLLGGPPQHCCLVTGLHSDSSVACLDPHSIKPSCSTARELLRHLAAPASPATYPLASLSSTLSLGFFLEHAAAWQAFKARFFSPAGLSHHLPFLSLQSQHMEEFSASFSRLQGMPAAWEDVDALTPHAPAVPPAPPTSHFHPLSTWVWGVYALVRNFIFY